ncbi:hypothetical protein EJH27_01550 [Salmonella enterica subsp. enterica serovar Virchow]|nr:hypothetical protein [Salmonella enterica subsp. enterica serovar Virchow]
MLTVTRPDFKVTGTDTVWVFISWKQTCHLKWLWSACYSSCTAGTVAFFLISQKELSVER